MSFIRCVYPKPLTSEEQGKMSKAKEKNLLYRNNCFCFMASTGSCVLVTSAACWFFYCVGAFAECCVLVNVWELPQTGSKCWLLSSGGVLREAADPGWQRPGWTGGRWDPKGRRCDWCGLPGGGRPLWVSPCVHVSAVYQPVPIPQVGALLRLCWCDHSWFSSAFISAHFSQKPTDSSQS